MTNETKLNWKPVIIGVAIFLAFQYACGIWNLTFSQNAMSNKFTVLAKDKYLVFLLGQNLRVLCAYMILWIIGVVLVYPIASLAQKKWLTTILSLAYSFAIHTFFVLRLSQSRPYFLHDAEFGNWYYKIVQSIPTWLNQFFFVIFPVIFLGVIAIYYSYKFLKSNFSITIKIILGFGAFLCLGIFFLTKKTENTHLTEQLAHNLNKKNIIIIGSDSLRGDRIGFNGYKPIRDNNKTNGGVSPTIDSLASNSQVFTKCFTPIASTLESNTSLQTSTYPHTHGLRHMYPNREQLEKTNQSIKSIGEILKGNNYTTCAIGDWCAGFYQVIPLGFNDVSVSSFDNFKIYMTQAVVMAHFAVPLYFDNQIGYKIFPEIESFAQFVTPNVVTDRVDKKITTLAASKNPFYMHVFYSSNHLPYRSKEPYCSMFSDPNYSGKNKTAVDFDIDSFIGSTDLESKWKVLSKEDMQQINALYDGCTRQFDDCIKQILDSLKRNGLDKNTIVIINSDHGDDLYEPGATLGHGLSFNGGDQTNHTPMIIYIPEIAAQRFDQITRSIDVAPSLLELLDIDRPTQWEGKSFASWITKKNAPSSRPFYAETGFPFIQFRVENVKRPKLPPMDELTTIDDSFNYAFVLKPKFESLLVSAKQRMLRSERWKIIYTPTINGDANYRLFFLPNDPHCERNIGLENSKILATMKSAINIWITEKRELSIEEIFPDGEP
jgi:arylsulfatase A-like enzyme